MKTKFTGLILLLLVGITAYFYKTYIDEHPEIYKPKTVTTLNGYLGGEKIGFVTDPEVKDILKKNFNMEFNYKKAGSLDMITSDLTNLNYLFPSSQTALELYNKVHGKAPQHEIIFNTPIVLYTRKTAADALVKSGMVTLDNNVYYMDMGKLLASMEKNTKWSDLGLPYWGSINVITTDPTKSNSGNMFAGLMANIINEGNVVNQSTLGNVNPRLKALIAKQGYMETSSQDIFDQFMKTGDGNKPIIAGYENQIIEFSMAYPNDWAKLANDIVVIYPVPTVWSTHIYIALDENGKTAINALKSPELQDLAWKKHGFRTGVAGSNQDVSIFKINGLAKDVTKIIPMPDVNTMEALIKNLSN